MARYNKRIVKRICDLISKDSFTIAEICEKVNISESCFYNWQATHVEFGEAIQKAREKFDDILAQEAKNSLRKLVSGYDVDEKRTVYIGGEDGKPKIKEQVTIKKHIQPNVAATIFMLTNKAPDEYKNKQFSELTGKDGKDLVPPAKILTKKEAKELLKELEDEC